MTTISFLLLLAGAIGGLSGLSGSPIEVEEQYRGPIVVIAPRHKQPVLKSLLDLKGAPAWHEPCQELQPYNKVPIHLTPPKHSYQEEAEEHKPLKRQRAKMVPPTLKELQRIRRSTTGARRGKEDLTGANQNELWLQGGRIKLQRQARGKPRTQKTSFAWSPVSGRRWSRPSSRFLVDDPSKQQVVVPMTTTKQEPICLSSREEAREEEAIMCNAQLLISTLACTEACGDTRNRAKQLELGVRERWLSLGGNRTQDMEEAERSVARWWPKFDRLLQPPTHPSGKRGWHPWHHDADLSERLLRNVSHHFQYFALAFEQMEWEQGGPDEPLWSYYNHLVRSNLKALCSIEELIEWLHQTRALLAQMTPYALERLKLRLSDHPGNPVHNIIASWQKAHKLESPVDEEVDDGKRHVFVSPMDAEMRAEKKSAFDTLVQREQMPLEERLLDNKSYGQRLARDLVILADYKKLVDFYQFLFAGPT